MAGKPYKLVKLPMPRAIFDEGERLPATYVNYLIMNGAVLVPTYNQPDLDAEALRVAKLMPKWEPGKDHGKVCRTKVAIPIVFEIQVLCRNNGDGLQEMNPTILM